MNLNRDLHLSDPSVHARGPLAAASSRRVAAVVTRLGVLLALILIAAVMAVATDGVGAAPLADKQAQAARLDAQVSALEERLSNLHERWRGARIELRKIDREIRETERELVATRADLTVAKRRLRDRAIEIYRVGAGSTQLLEVARAGSFSELFERLEAIERVGEQDADIVADVRALQARIEAQEQRLAASRARQSRVVARAARDEREMRRLVERKQAALNSVNAEIVAIMEAQRAAAAAANEAASRARMRQLAAGAADEVSLPGDPTPSGEDAGDGAGAGGGGDDDQAAAPVSVPVPPASGAASAAAGIAMGKVGAPYEFGAAGPDTFDCSGLILWAFAQAGRPGMPHSSYAYMGMGVEVPLSQAQSGDIVITDGGGHAGIYVGGGSFVHAPREGRTVAVESLGYYSVVSVRRV